ncbi:MAG TPA: alpha/beta hydrolase-fold protein [Chthoniobacterales bacterium]|nr:alpha/beta hydrolase-fold protein [Chthoniobacterales bacterium]
MSRIRFEIIPPVGRPEEPVSLCGNVHALGEWDASRALTLRWEGDRHVGTIEADTGAVLEYKVLRGGRWEAEAVDAWGSVPPNARHEVWLDATVHRTVGDWKDRHTGRLMRDRVYSRVLASWRELLIWLPPAYVTDSERRFPVLYLNDGANVFDPETSPLSRVDLAADEWVRALSAEGAMPETIVVGVCHPEGFAEGMRSERDIDLSPELGGAAYTQFLATELVPALDMRYRTLAKREARTIGGTSLGGVSAFYTILHHADVFGRMFGLSTSFEDVSQSPPAECAALRMLDGRSTLPGDIRCYFDYGTEGIDAGCEPFHHHLLAQLSAKGWEDGREFHVLRVIGGGHHEQSWRLRLGDALRFLQDK